LLLELSIDLTAVHFHLVALLNHVLKHLLSTEARLHASHTTTWLETFGWLVLLYKIVLRLLRVDESRVFGLMLAQYL